MSEKEKKELVCQLKSKVRKNQLEAIDEIIKNEKKVTVKVTVNQQKIINAIKSNPFVTQEELADIVGITRKNIIANMKKHIPINPLNPANRNINLRNHKAEHKNVSEEVCRSTNGSKNNVRYTRR